MKPLNILFFVFLFLYSCSLNAQTTYYVSSSQGNDGSNGTSESSAWRTISKVNSRTFLPGDKILFRSGDIWNEGLIVNSAGNANNYITYDSYSSGNKPIISSSNDPVIESSKPYVRISNIYVKLGNSIGIQNGGQNNIIENCIVEGISGSSKHLIGIRLWANSNGSIVKNCEVFNITEGILASGPFNQAIILEYNYVHDTNAGGGNGQDAIAIGNQGRDYSGSIVRYNKITRWGDDAIDLFFAINVIAEYNEIHDPLSNGYEGNGFKVGRAEGGQYGNIIRYNKIYNLFADGSSGGGGGNDAIQLNQPSMQAYGNLIYNIKGNGILLVSGKDNQRIFNNTIIISPTSNSSAIYCEGPTNNTIIRNNILKGGNSGSDLRVSGGSISGGNNCFVKDNGPSGSGYIGLFDYGNTDPMFVNAASGNYKLQNGSPCVQSGIIIPEYLFDIEGNPILAGIIPNRGPYQNTSGGGGGNQYVNVNIKVFLEGSYNNGSMNTTLKDSGFIPLSQSYNIFPWNYGGSESVSNIPPGVVDWVLIELRTGTQASTTTASRTAFVKNNGSVVDLDGVSNVTFNNVNSDSYYIVIKHRNHLSIMSANAVSLNSTSPLYDFTTGQNKAYGNEPLANLGSAYGMYAGDGDINDLISVLDYGVVEGSLFQSGYKIGDHDMNGIVNVIDYGMTNWNILKTSQVP